MRGGCVLTGRLNCCGKGYLRVRISGAGVERFLNLCLANGIETWELRACGERGAECCMELSQFYRIRPFVRKAGVRVRIAGRYGLPFFIYRNRYREGAACGILAFAGLLYLLTLFVWNITFEGNYHYSRDTLLSYLETLDIRYGMRKNRISCEDLEESIRSAFPEITWVSASVAGTRLVVRIKENEVLSSVPERDDTPCELTAKRAGTITRMIVRQGKACAAIGDVVEEGQLLVASGLSVMNDAGEVVRTKYVRADADIYAQTHYTYQKTLPGLCRQEVPSGRVRREYRLSVGAFRARMRLPARGELWAGVRDGALSFAKWLAEKAGLDKCIPFPAAQAETAVWNETAESRQLCLFGDFFLPVYWEECVSREVYIYERSYTREELSALAQEEEAKYLENLCEKGVHIMKNNVKILEYGTSLRIEGTVTAEEEIAQARAVDVPDTSGEELSKEP